MEEFLRGKDEWPADNIHRALLPLVQETEESAAGLDDGSQGINFMDAPTLFGVLLHADESKIQKAALEFLVEQLSISHLKDLDSQDDSFADASFASSTLKLILSHLRFSASRARKKMGTPLERASNLLDAVDGCPNSSVATRILEEFPNLPGINDPSAVGFVLVKLKELILNQPELTIPALHAATNVTYSRVAGDLDSERDEYDDEGEEDNAGTSTAVLIASMLESALAAAPSERLQAVVLLTLEHTSSLGRLVGSVPRKQLDAVVMKEKSSVSLLLQSMRKTLAAEWGRGRRADTKANPEMEVLSTIHDRAEILPQFRSELLHHFDRTVGPATYSSADIWLLLVLVGVDLRDAGSALLRRGCSSLTVASNACGWVFTTWRSIGPRGTSSFAEPS
jgi:hypothetical protein